MPWFEAEVGIGPGEKAYVIGRNGMFTPRSVRIWQDGDMAHIEAIGRRGPINAGISIVPEKMDKLAMKWLQSRGLVMPASEK